MNLAALEFAGICAVATFAAGTSLRVPALRPHALAASACAALYAGRAVGGARVAVAVYVLWPGVAALVGRILGSWSAPRSPAPPVVLVIRGVSVTLHPEAAAYVQAQMGAGTK